MNNVLYYPITATPLKRNNSYVEILPNQLLTPYIRCYWRSEYPLIQVELDESPELVIPDTCVDIIYHIDYTDNVVTGGFCGVNDCSFYANNDGTTGHEVSTFVKHVTALEICVMDVILVKERFFMHQKEKHVQFMIVFETINV